MKFPVLKAEMTLPSFKGEMSFALEHEVFCIESRDDSSFFNMKIPALKADMTLASKT